MDLIDIILIVLIAACFGSAVWKVIKMRKKGGCSCGCSECARDCPQRREDI